MSQNLKIGILCDPNSFHTAKWARALQKQGVEVTVFSFFEGKINGVNCVKIEPPFTLAGRLTYLSYLYGGKQLAHALKVHKIDLLNPINITPYGVWATRSSFAPIAGIGMGSDILEYPPRYKDRPAIRWDTSGDSGIFQPLLHRVRHVFFRHHVKAALHKMQLITGDNLVLTSAIEQWFGIPRKRVQLNRWGVEADLFVPDPIRIEKLKKHFGIKPGDKVILSPRGLRPVYQGGIIFDGLERLLSGNSKNTKIILLSAGYGFSEEWGQKARALAAQDERFHFEEGLIEREDVLALWSLVDIFISAPVYDGYSNAVAEGRYAGAIPVVNAIEAHEELFIHQKNAWIVQPFTAKNLAENLKRLLADLAKWKPIFATENRIWIEKHSMMDANMAHFLRSALALSSSFS